MAAALFLSLHLFGIAHPNVIVPRVPFIFHPDAPRGNRQARRRDKALSR